MKRHHVGCGFVVLFVLLATTQTQARIQPNPNISQNKGSKGVVFVNRDQLLQMANGRGVKVLTFKISKHELAKLAASGPKRCGCAVEDLAPGGSSCMKDCFADWGINPGSVADCASICGLGMVNPVAAFLCAVCLGAGEAIVIACAVRCSSQLTQNVAPKTPLP